jgi:hypothetical protein
MFEDTDPGFVDAANRGFPAPAGRRRCSTRSGFRPIPMHEIGLYQHPYRASWPVDTTPVAEHHHCEGIPRVLCGSAWTTR